MKTIKRIRPSRVMPRRGFTLVELIVAGVIMTFVLGSVTTTMSQLGRAKSSSKRRLDAFLRADAALNLIRRDIVSIIRTDDLFYTRLYLVDDSVRRGDEEFDRDEILVFNTQLRPLRNIDFNGEGFEYETQYRISEDSMGPALWQRRDVMPDEFPLGGGTATPVVEGILSIGIQAYDGYAWYDEWDSDVLGLPLAVGVVIVSCGHRGPSDLYDSPRAVLRTVIPIDRVLPPRDLFEVDEDVDEAAEDAEMSADEALDSIQMDGIIIERDGDRANPGGPDRPRDRDGRRPGTPGRQDPRRPVTPNRPQSKPGGPDSLAPRSGGANPR